jgi:hypothetical protein
VNSTLKDDPIWSNLAQTLKQFDPNQIALQHLQLCNDQINGYWDEDEFYEVITFNKKLEPELLSSSLGISSVEEENAHWLSLKFALTINPNAQDLSDLLPNQQKDILGELTLVLDENLRVVDENWLIDLNSPYVWAKP